MSTPTPSAPAPKPQFAIDYSPAVLDRIRGELEAALHSSREAGGILFGNTAVDGIHILSSRPLPCEHAMGPGFVLSARDEKRLAEIVSSTPAEPGLVGLQILGWYHSHIASPIFLSERDLEIHSRHFSKSFQVALVIHLSSERRPRGTFFYREPSGEMRTDSRYQEFTIQPAAPPSVASSPSPFAVSPGRPVAALRTPPPLPRACPKCGSQRFRRSHRSNTLEGLAGLFGYYPFRCQECLSRSFLKTAGIWDRIHHTSRKRPEERRRAWLRTRREILLWSGGILGFLLILLYLVRDTGPTSYQP